jgi:formate C-acetyltransferase
MKFEPDCFAGKEGADRFEALTQHFVRDRIQQLQFNATGNETLLKARNRPGDFPNLVVRVSGFSAYFVNLAPEVQEDVIRRRAHRLIPSEASD